MGCNISASVKDSQSRGGESVASSVLAKVLPGKTGAMNFSVIVVGGTGLIGREVVRQCLYNKWRVRVPTRNKKSEMCRIFSKMGVEVIEVDWTNRASLVAAAAMIDSGILITPFLETEPESALLWVDALAVASTVGRLVYITSSFDYDVDTKLGEFDSKVVAAVNEKSHYFQKGWAQIRSPLVMQAWLKHFICPIVEKKVHKQPFDDLQFSWIDARDVADVACRLALPSSSVKKDVVKLAGPEAFTHSGAADMISKCVGSKIAVENIGVDEWAMVLHMSVGGCEELLRHVKKYPQQAAAKDNGEYKTLFATPLRTFPDFLRENFTPETLTQDLRSFV